MNEIQEYKPLTPLTASDVLAQVGTIKEIMQKAMIKDVHYGTIPGTQSPTLYKAGSDMLLSAFHIAVEPVIEDLSTYQEIRYRIQCKGLTMGSGQLVGVGIGECSSNEEKYKWRRCNRREYESAPEDRRRIKYVQKGGGQSGFWENEQIRQEPVDVANTVLKMAKKRAAIDLTLTVLAASDVFDRPAVEPGAPQGLADEPVNQYPQQPDIPPGFDDPPAGDGELNLGHVRTAMSKSGLRDVDLWAHLEVAAWNEIAGDKLAGAMKWIEENQP